MIGTTENSFSIYSGPAAEQVHILAWERVRSLLVGHALAIADDHESFHLEDPTIDVWKVSYEQLPVKGYDSVLIHTISKENIAKVVSYLSLFPPTYVVVLAHNRFSPDHLFTETARVLGRGKLHHLFYNISEIEIPLQERGYIIDVSFSSIFIPLSVMGLFPTAIQSKLANTLRKLDALWGEKHKIFWGRNIIKRYTKYTKKEERTWIIDHNVKISDTFDSEYDSSTDQGYVYKREVEKLLNLADVKLGDKVLDLGCGTGTYALEVARLGASSIGSDLVLPMLDITKTKGIKNGYIIPVVNLDGQYMPFKNEVFDTILTVITNDIPSIDSLFSEAYRILKPGGKLILLNYTNLTSIGGVKAILKTLLKYKAYKYYYIRFNDQLSQVAKRHRLKLKAKMGVGLFVGSGLSWKVQKKLLKDMDSLERKFSKSIFSFAYPQTFLLFQKEKAQESTVGKKSL